ncbi:MAG TPA: TonB-dependent receptor [Bryobacteraceae bacterium]|nr:TonB-dependent receptor [Bryobacteraceae bacterium]
MPRCMVVRSVAATLSVMAILAVANLFTGHANAQVSGATLSGTVTDPSGAVIAGAQVSIANKATAATRAVTTDAAGLYSAPNLQPGDYAVTITATGFQTTKEENVTLTVGGQQTLNVALRIGEAAQTVLVAEAAPAIQLGTSTISSEIESKQVLDMPLNGRSWTDLATLSPGVNAIETQMPFETGAVRGNRGFGSQLTISGGRPTQNNYRLDGLSINDYGNGGPGSVLGVTLGVDAIQEFSVVTGNYSAEYGRTSGGIVNATSKAGTNTFHGDAYEFLRNKALDANDFFSNAAGSPKPPYRENQFGIAAGGPIIKDRTFVFADYEGIRLTEGVTIVDNVPSDAARLGNMANGTHINVSPIITKYLGLYPHPNLPQSPTSDKGHFVFSGAKVGSENFGTIRGDHKISDKDSLFATYMYDGTPFTQPDAFNDVSILDQTTRYIAALEETHIFTPTLLNTVRLGYNRNAVINYKIDGAINPLSKDPTLGVFLGGYNPQTRIQGGFTNLTPGLGGGFTNFYWNSVQLYDDAFWTRGNHSLKFGFAMENMRYNFHQFYNPYGILTFHTLGDFLNNNAAILEGGLPDRVNPRGLRQTLYGGYIQDDWKMRKNLTLNLGLRYEMTTVLSEVHGQLTNLRNITDPLPYCGTTNPALTQIITPATPNGPAGCTGASSYYSNPTTHNFEPRIGFAYDPKGDGKTAIRGGFALFDILPLPGYFFTQQGIEMPFFLDAIVHSSTTPIQLGVSPSSPASAYQHLGPGNLLGAYFEPNPHRNYIEQWNINVQRQITSSVSAQVGYLGSHGVHMMMRGDDYDMVIPTDTSAGWLWPYNPTGKDLRLNTNFGGIRGMNYGSGSSYEAVLFSVNKRFSHGFLLGGSYTYSKAMDSSSATIAGDAFSNSITTWYWFAPQISWAPSDFNITHTAVANATWQVPVPQGWNGAAKGVLGGWQVGGIFKANSGVPTTPLIAGDPLQIQNGASDPFSIPSVVPGCNPVNNNFKSNPGGVFLGYINYSCYHVPMATPAIAAQCVPFSAVPGSCSNLLGNAGRNSIVGPNLVNLDFSLIRNFSVKKISENFNIQFRAEFFNILNHANFAPPLPFFGAANSQIFNPDGSSAQSGGLQGLTTFPRIIQFALKVAW